MEKHEEDGSIKHIDLGMVGEVTGVKQTYWRCLLKVTLFLLLLL